jgi:Cu(I)/Ag(I) efflux system membrane fusion protein
MIFPFRVRNDEDRGRLRRAALVGLAVLVLLGLTMIGSRFLHREASGLADVRELDGLRVAVATKPAAPKVGENLLRVLVVDAAGKPVKAARVEAVVSMPSMGGMPYMESRPPMKDKGGGRYEGMFNLTMAGSWNVDLQVAPPGDRARRAELRLTVGNPTLTWITDEETSNGVPGAAVSTSDTALAAGAELGPITLSESRRQEIGVTTAPIEIRDLSFSRRAAGRVAFDETRRAEVALKFQGYVRSLRADFVGQPVRRGQTLLTVYSPELYSAQREFLDAIAGRDAEPAGPSRIRAQELADAARQRLALWDLTSAQIAELERTKKPAQATAIVSPVSGVIVEKMVVQGSAVMPGQTLFRIAPIDPVWVLADVYPYELPFLKVGQTVTVNVPFAGGRERRGRISFVAPFLAADTRTAQVRIDVPNGDRALRPDQLVDVEISVGLGKWPAVPFSAVLYSGERRIVFIDRGGGRLEPREITLGPRSGDFFPVRSGLSAGDVVVTSGNFLVASESRLRAGSGRR